MVFLLDAQTAIEIFEEIHHRAPRKLTHDFVAFSAETSAWCVNYLLKRYGDLQPEKFAMLMSLIFLAWSSYILEAKGIYHKGKPADQIRNTLEKNYIPDIKSIILDSRNFAVKRKIHERFQGNIPDSIIIPSPYKKFDDCTETMEKQDSTNEEVESS